jgi:hypothetical protein
MGNGCMIERRTRSIAKNQIRAELKLEIASPLNCFSMGSIRRPKARKPASMIGRKMLTMIFPITLYCHLSFLMNSLNWCFIKAVERLIRIEFEFKLLAYFTANKSTYSITGFLASNSGAFSIKALAIGPFKWAFRPSSYSKVSKMPNMESPN